MCKENELKYITRGLDLQKIKMKLIDYIANSWWLKISNSKQQTSMI